MLVTTLLAAAVLSQGPPVTSGLKGFYVGDSYVAASNSWRDISGNNQHATTSGTINYNALGINGEDFLSGGTGARVTLPQSFSGNTYTFFHVTK